MKIKSQDMPLMWAIIIIMNMTYDYWVKEIIYGQSKVKALY